MDAVGRQAASAVGLLPVRQQIGTQPVEHTGVDARQLHRAEPRNDMQPQIPTVGVVRGWAERRLNRGEPINDDSATVCLVGSM
jgi:hypothetical protein